jgi:hypothetical protein
VLSFPSFYRQARKELLEEKSNIRREIEETILLLRETARRHTQAEKTKEGMFMRLIVSVVVLIKRSYEGLVVLEASYGPTDPDPEARALIVDVTVPIQALVHKSQLYIPGHRSKVRTLSLMTGVFSHRPNSRAYRAFTTLCHHVRNPCTYVIRSGVGCTIVRSPIINQLSFLWEVSRAVISCS